MGKIESVGHLHRDITESAANTYTEQTLNTNVNPLSNQVLLVHDVFFEWKVTPPLVNSADAAKIVLIKQSKNSMPTRDDPDVIATRGVGFSLATSGAGWIELEKQIHFDPPEIIAVDELVIGIQGTSIATALTAAIDIRYTPTTVTDADFIKLAKA